MKNSRKIKEPSVLRGKPNKVLREDLAYLGLVPSFRVAGTTTTLVVLLRLLTSAFCFPNARRLSKPHQIHSRGGVRSG